jgi:hypothetical protein
MHFLLLPMETPRERATSELRGEISRGGRQELGVMIHGAELGHVNATSVCHRQRSTHLGAKICGAEPCYLGATGCGAEQRVQK